MSSSFDNTGSRAQAALTEALGLAHARVGDVALAAGRGAAREGAQAGQLPRRGALGRRGAECQSRPGLRARP